MLQIIESYNQLNMFDLLLVYEESNLEHGAACAPDASKWEQLRIGEAHMRDYVLNFLKTPGSKIAVCATENGYVSALRLEGYDDGFLITGLETLPGARGSGYATSLLKEVADCVPEKLYAHVKKGNHPSIAAHKRAGFKVILDHATLLDGTVSSQYFTLEIH